ncbi:ABC transporter permease [Pontibacillus litoralis]|uniref:ABC transporter permease n=1 Tax=Pontibacillus litoralis JSM 072002 TaxID=1385512 RepID=A0A0A5G690_9BACI|nr:ABC transporter permease subunit [Pontibacillus litoralis]KGX86605.1 ABC transporter permease [Pontibacillus litoralis JSM 072002]
MSKRKENLLGIAMVMPSFISLLILVIWPVMISIKESFMNGEGQFSFENYIYVFTEPMMLNNIKHTVVVTLISCIIVLFISYFIAIYLRFTSSKIANFIRKTYFIPMFVPGIIAIYGFINTYRDNGWIARLIGQENLPVLMYDIKGVVMMNMWFNIPFTTMLLVSALSAIPDSVIESAKDVGATKLKIFWKFIFPLSYKTMLVATTFLFMGIVGSFTAPFLVDSNAPQMLGVSMQQHFSVYHEFGQASSIAVIMFIMSAGIGYLYIHSMMKEEK